MSELYDTRKAETDADGADEPQQMPIHDEGSVPDEKRRPGRKPGSPKPAGSGRAKGVKNKVSKKTKETVTDIFDKNGPQAMQRLFHIAMGHRIRVGTSAGPGAAEYIYPSESSQMRALETLARKLKPDLASQAITGPDNSSLFQAAEPQAPRQISRAVLQILASGVDENNSDGPFIPLPTGGNASAMPPLSADGDAGSASPAAVAPGGPAVQDAAGSPINGAAYPVPGDWRGDDEAETGLIENGERILIGDAGHSIQLRERGNDGRERYLIFNDADQQVAAAWGKAEAEARCQELIDTGRISR